MLFLNPLRGGVAMGSNILNTEKGEGESIEFNAISLKMRQNAQIIDNFYECLNHFAQDCLSGLNICLPGNICYTFAKLSKHTFGETIH